MIASERCGLDDLEGVVTLPAGDTAALTGASDRYEAAVSLPACIRLF